ncbi:MAG: hypothetical protein LBG59_00255 [Candidatus Peribacteria bacterium]|nr:hypothetical protein [Candidatus Peribacteria bacterium]
MTGVDPQFVNTINGDFTLQATSPAINRGSAVALTRDFSGTTVPLYASVDIGAFERIDTIPPIATYTPTSGTTTI